MLLFCVINLLVVLCPQWLLLCHQMSQEGHWQVLELKTWWSNWFDWLTWLQFTSQKADEQLVKPKNLIYTTNILNTYKKQSFLKKSQFSTSFEMYYYTDCWSVCRVLKVFVYSLDCTRHKLGDANPSHCTKIYPKYSGCGCCHLALLMSFGARACT